MPLCVSVSDRSARVTVVSVFQSAPCCVCVSDCSMLCLCFRALHVTVESVFQIAPCCVRVSDRSMLPLSPCFRLPHDAVGPGVVGGFDPQHRGDGDDGQRLAGVT